MKVNRCAALAVMAFLLCAKAQAVTIPTVLVGNPGNPGDTEVTTCCNLATGSTGHGAVDYSFRIAKYEVTNAQYVEFLNAVDPTGTNALALYEYQMYSDPRGGILYDGSAANGSKYSVKPGRDHNPVVYVSFYSAIRFANWLHNGQGSGDTETGAYTLLGGSPVPLFGDSITRNAGAKWWVPSEDEWYKAAYHKNDGVTGNYWDYPTSTDLEPYSAMPPGTSAPDASNTANFFKNDGVSNGYDDGLAVTGSPFYNFPTNYLTDVGSYTSAVGPYGTFDQAGNVWEWTEANIFGNRILRGGSWSGQSHLMMSSLRSFTSAWVGGLDIGFRVATIVPEPTSLGFGVLGVLMLIGRVRRR